jgi:hypothetical protein
MKLLGKQEADNVEIFVMRVRKPAGITLRFRVSPSPGERIRRPDEMLWEKVFHP